MDQVVPPPQQPDFTLISHCYRQLSTELEKCRNLPAINQGDTLLAALQRIDARLDRLEQRFDRLEDRLEDRLSKLEIRQQASDHNSIARLQNSGIQSPNVQLTELHAVDTNTPIPGFPETVEDIRSLSNAALNHMLRALGVGITGTMDSRRQRLRLQIGLKAKEV